MKRKGMHLPNKGERDYDIDEQVSAKYAQYSWQEEERETCTAFKGTSPEDTAATTLITRAATLTVSWNWINF